jgi:hypothetical protein
MYTYIYTNRLEQFGWLFCTLVISDADANEAARIDKQFRLDTLTDDTLVQDSTAEITKLTE